MGKKLYLGMVIINLLLFTACGSDNNRNTLMDINQNVDSTGTMADQTYEDEITGGTGTSENLFSSKENDGGQLLSSVVFNKGTWFGVKGEISLGYFSFDPETHAGIIHGLTDGSCREFTYQEVDNTVTITCEGELLYTGTMEQLDEYTVVLTLENNEQIILTYVSDRTGDEFIYYTTVELVDMAQKYYEKENSVLPSGATYFDNSDSTITIRLFEGEGTRDNPDAEYTLNRITATGTDDLTEEAVDVNLQGN
ncbi:MAG: hypothetical protein ACI39R_02065 [Lachnospiraceae bacterium]